MLCSEIYYTLGRDVENSQGHQSSDETRDESDHQQREKSGSFSQEIQARQLIYGKVRVEIKVWVNTDLFPFLKHLVKSSMPCHQPS